MNITAKTTDQDLVRNVGYIRTRIREAMEDVALEAGISEALAGLANDLAHAEGVLFARLTVRDGLVAGWNTQQIKDRLMRQVFNGADDTWSGRKNDVRRAWFDGFRDEARDQIERLG